MAICANVNGWRMHYIDEGEGDPVVDALEPIDSDALDRDLWAILRWMIGGLGGAWTVEDFDRTRRLYRVDAAPSN